MAGFAIHEGFNISCQQYKLNSLIHPDIQEYIKTVVNKRRGPIEDSSFNGVRNTPDFLIDLK